MRRRAGVAFKLVTVGRANMACDLTYCRASLMTFVVLAFHVIRGIDGYSVGDYVPMARRGQFNNVRNQRDWHLLTRLAG